MTGLQGRRILIVEDEALHAAAAEVLLLGFGCEVVGPAASIDQARRLARREAIDAALLDVNVGGELVYPVARQLIDRDVPVILCSGSDAGIAIAAPYDTLPRLAKPFDQDSLHKALVAALDSPVRRMA